MSQQQGRQQGQQQGRQRGRAARAPRFSAFLATGGFAGLLAGLFLGVIGPVDARYASASAAGFLGLIFAALGTLAGGLVAVLIEKRR